MGWAKKFRTSLYERRPAESPRQLLAILIASGCAITANVLLYFVLKEFVGIEFIAPDEFSREVAPLPASDVVIFSILFCVGASLVFLIVANTTNRPAPIFIGISLVILLLSFLLPLKIPTPPIPMATKWSLVSMHLLGALVLVPLLVAIGLPVTAQEPLDRRQDVGADD